MTSASPLRSDGPGGRVIRRVLPMCVAALLALGSLRWLGEYLGLYSTTVGIALLTTAAMAFIAGVLWRLAASLDREDATQRQAEADVSQSSRYFDLTRDKVCTAGFDGIFTQVNPAWTDSLGWSKKELCSRPFVEFVHPDDRDRTVQETAGLTAGGVTIDFANRYATKGGAWRWLEWRASANLEEQLIYASARDVTDRKEAEAALEASERQTRQILETANDAFISIGADGLVTDWNPQAEITFGWSRDEALGRNLSETIIPERYREAHRHGIERFLKTEKGERMNEVLNLPALHRDGREIPVELTVSPLRTENGWSFNAFVRDVTEQDAAAKLLEHQREQLIEAQSVGQYGSWEWHIADDTMEWSDELHRIFGREPGDTPGSLEAAMQWTHPDDRARVQAAVEETLETGEPFSIDQRAIHPDGTVRYIQTRGELIMGDDSTPERLVGTGQDISDRHEAERAKDEFTAVVSHELRTPLTSIRGSLGLLESGVLGPLPAKGQRMIEIAVANTDRLVRLINDILDIERINSGEIDMQMEECDAALLVERAIESLEPLAAEAEVKLVADVTAVSFPADPDRIMQTLTNLISNAVKFSPNGATVTVSCSRDEEEVLLTVADQGRGIPAESLDSIFERFQQIDASDSREKGGTGLGLAICRTIVENHGGRIWAESVLGEGSTFSFALPTSAGRSSTGAPLIGVGGAR